MTVSRAKGAKAKADRLFSLIIRSKGQCENCPESRYEQLQTAHIISRRYARTRCDLDNAFCLCAKDHAYFTDHPVDFASFVLAKGVDYAELHDRAHAPWKVDWDAEVKRLTAIWKQLEDAA